MTWTGDAAADNLNRVISVVSDSLGPLHPVTEYAKGHRKGEPTVGVGVGWLATEAHVEPLSDSHLADAADLPRFDPLEHINPLDA